jgi:hypothetical protein
MVESNCPPSFGVVVFNHEHTAAAFRLREAFGRHAPAVAFDSGSRLSHDERAQFDRAFENIYYAGLMNEAVAHATSAGFCALLVVCSDVVVDDAGALVERAKQALFASGAGVYAPAMDKSSHRSMRRQKGHDLRDVAFVEGVCFAARTELLRDLCPVDLRLNRIGWGLDVQLGYSAFAHGLRVVVDDAVEVRHPVESGYAKDDARRQRDAWFRTLSIHARLFRLLTGMKWSHTARGVAFIRSIFVRPRAEPRTT